MIPFRNILIYSTALFLVSCSKPEEAQAPEPVADVTMTKVETGDMQTIIRGFGRIEYDPAGQSILVAEIEAQVTALEVQPGATVAKGAVVLRLGPSSGTGLEMVQAQRDAAAAEAEAARTKRLRADGLAGDGEVEAAETRAKNLKSLAESLTQRAGSTSVLRSPLEGIVDDVFVATGQLVSPGTPLARIASHHALQARIGVEIDESASLKTGDKVRLSALGREGEVVESSIKMVDPRLDPATRMANVVVTLPSGNGFLAGEQVRGDIIAASKPNVAQVPRKSVFIDETGPFVFVAMDGRASLRRVETGISTGEKTEITNGLAPGETVVVEGAAVLSDGIKVRDYQLEQGRKP